MWLQDGPRAFVGLGSRRLSIIDVPGGHQPMSNEDGSVVVVFNGEIYNYRELRAELLSKGHRFQTVSDTEILVHLYEEHGWECVSRLRGMFAFALWDARKRVLVLARDPLGIKPLFFRYDRQCVMFASELRGLLAAFEEVPDVRYATLLRLLVLQYIPAPDTAFVGVQKLMPGMVLLVDEHGTDPRRYWHLPREGGVEGDRAPTNVSREVLDRLYEAVQCHLLSDVPVGAFLSGGLDSTSIVALMSRAGTSAIETFSVGFEGPSGFTELPYAREAAARYGTTHHELVVTPKDVMESLPRIVCHLDEPLSDPAIVPTYLLSTFAAQFVKVVLTGEGADELFGGYQRYGLDRLAAWYQHVPSILRACLLNGLQRCSANRRMVQGILALSQPLSSRRHRIWVGTFTAEELMEVVADPVAVACEEQWLAQLFQTYFDGSQERGSAVSGMLRADLSTWLPDDLLAKIDRMSMAASLEARVPYLDLPFVELVMNLPTALKIKNGVRKAVLRAAVADLVPPAILNRSKMGFEMPLALWMRGPLREFVGDLLALEAPPGLFNQTGVKRYWDQHLRGTQDRSRQVWSVLLVKLWCQEVVRKRAGVAC